MKIFPESCFRHKQWCGIQLALLGTFKTATTFNFLHVQFPQVIKKTPILLCCLCSLNFHIFPSPAPHSAFLTCLSYCTHCIMWNYHFLGVKTLSITPNIIFSHSLLLLFWNLTSSLKRRNPFFFHLIKSHCSGFLLLKSYGIRVKCRLTFLWLHSLLPREATTLFAANHLESMSPSLPAAFSKHSHVGFSIWVLSTCG